MLADRITLRDPGNAPAAGDRIGYIYILPKAGQEASKLQGDRIETPLYIKENALIPDYRHYIEHQLQNPISQAFALFLEQIPGFSADMVRGCPPASEDLDRYLAFREGKAADLLFSECLQRFENASKRTAMFSMFGSNVVITPKAVVQKEVVKKAPMKVATQTKMSSFLLDSYLVNEINKKQRAKKKEDQ